MEEVKSYVILDENNIWQSTLMYVTIEERNKEIRELRKRMEADSLRKGTQFFLYEIVPPHETFTL
jgi:hypothetical protein